MHRQRALEALLRVVVAELNGLHVAVDELRLLRVRLGQQRANLFEVQIEQGGEHARIADVLHQDARAHPVEILIAELRQRHAEHRDVFALQQCGPRPRGVVEEVAAGSHFLHVARVGFRVHGDHDVHATGASHVALLRHADLIPRGQSLDVGGEVVLPHHRDAAAEDGLHQQRVGARGTCTVDRSDLDNEIVGLHRLQAIFGFLASIARASSSACGQCTCDFCISHAAVGQRSAHSPQCTQMSSSFTITRPVCLSAVET